MLFITFTAVISLLAGAMASPIANSDHTLAKRAEGVHLVNCGADSDGNPIYSMVVYCPNDSNCNHFPTTSNKCVVPPNGGFDHWEGAATAQSPHSCTFSTGVTFSWSINSNAQSPAVPTFSVVGSGSNGHSFVIRKDDKHIMFTDGNGNQCKSIYYCLDN